MSIKLYSGYKLVDGVSPYQVQREVAEILRPAQLAQNYQNVLNQAVHDFDNEVRREKKKKYASDALFFDVLKSNIKEELAEKKNSYAITNSKIVLLENSVRNEQYAIFFGSNDAEKVFKTLPSVKSEFGYWDNSDSYPEGVNSSKEWADRLAAWEQAMDFDESVGSQGLIVEVLSEFELTYFSTHDVYEHRDFLTFPSDEKRMHRLGEGMYTDFIANSTSLRKDHDLIEIVSRAMYDFRTLDNKQEWLDKAAAFVKPLSWESYPYKNQ